ncbi:acetylglutamate kinase [Glaciecola sp. SC05]|uniref:acetylglutamate kinase n=1 Tax=Glaciecola sp. SC05 TaxID=1987355 RepID=UPI003526D0CF
MSEQTSIIVIKVGGRFFDELLAVDGNKHPLLSAIKALQSRGKQVVLVHGGGDQVQAQLKALNMHSEKIDGLRVTPFSHMPVVAGVLCGYLNKTLVARSASIGLKSVGISLADGNIAECVQVSQHLGAVGRPIAKDAALLKQLFNNNMLPIVASIGTDKTGNLYNVNADHAAICIAQLLNAKLLLLSDVSGVLNSDKIKLAQLNAKQAQQMIDDKIITDGMIVKVLAAQDSADLLGSAVTIGSWNDLSAMTENDTVFGTQIFPRAEAGANPHMQ